VNDGGAGRTSRMRRSSSHETSRGRSRRPMRGVRAAVRTRSSRFSMRRSLLSGASGHVANAARSAHAAWYTDAVSGVPRPNERGSYERIRACAVRAGLRPALLLLDNYIPLRRSSCNATCSSTWAASIRLRSLRRLGFPDPPLAARSFLRVPRITSRCATRGRLVGGTAAPEGTPALPRRQAAGVAEARRAHR